MEAQGRAETRVEIQRQGSKGFWEAVTSDCALEGQREDTQRPENGPSRQGEQPEQSLCITSKQIGSIKHGMHKRGGVRPKEQAETWVRAQLRVPWWNCLTVCQALDIQHFLIPKTMPERNPYPTSASWDLRAAGAELEVTLFVWLQGPCPLDPQPPLTEKLWRCKPPHPLPRDPSLKAVPGPRRSSVREA